MSYAQLKLDARCCFRLGKTVTLRWGLLRQAWKNNISKWIFGAHNTGHCSNCGNLQTHDMWLQDTDWCAEGIYFLECSPRMEFHENSQCLSFFKKQNCLAMCFHASPRCMGRSEFTSAVIIHGPLWKTGFATCSLPMWLNTLPMWFFLTFRAEIAWCSE